MMRVLGRLCVLTLLAFGAQPAAAAKPKLLVQDLVAQGVEAHEAAVMSTAACQAFSKGDFDVLCGDDIRNMMRFGAMTAAFDGCQDEKCYANVGRAVKARYVVSGSVSKFGAGFILSLSMFDTEEGRPAGRTEVKAETIEKLHAQVAEAASAVRRAR